MIKEAIGVGETLEEATEKAKAELNVSFEDEVQFEVLANPKKKTLGLFGGSPASKLFMNVREKEGLCYYCSSYPAARKNIIFVSCGLEQGFEDKATDAIFHEIDEMKNGRENVDQ